MHSTTDERNIIGMKIGYARRSKSGLKVADQQAELLEAGAERLYADDVQPREPLAMMAEAVRALREGDVLVVTILDRLGRCRRELVEALQKVHAKGATLLVLDDGTETTAKGVALAVKIECASKHWATEKGMAGIEAAKQVRTRQVPKRKLNGADEQLVKTLYFDLSRPLSEVEQYAKVDASTLWRRFGPRTQKDGETDEQFAARKAVVVPAKPKRRRT